MIILNKKFIGIRISKLILELFLIIFFFIRIDESTPNENTLPYFIYIALSLFFINALLDGCMINNYINNYNRMFINHSLLQNWKHCFVSHKFKSAVFFLIFFTAFFKKMFIFHENVFFMKKIILNSYKIFYFL